MSETRLQDEYNKAIRTCDVFVSLFFTKTGRFTEEEFDVAHEQFTLAQKPLIYTFFKNADIKAGSAREEISCRYGRSGSVYTRWDISRRRTTTLIS